MDVNELVQEKIPEHMNQPRIINTVSSFITEFTDIEQDIDDTNDAIFIDTAQGDELDSLGAFFKLGREANESDSAYRERIKKARDKANVCGVRALIQTYLQELVGSYATVTESPSSPMILTAKIPLGTTYPLSTIQDLVETIKSAGIKVFYTSDVFDDSTITFSEVLLPLVDTATRMKADIHKPEAGVWLS